MSNLQEPKDNTSVSGVPVSLVFAVILAIVVAIFALQNSADVVLKAFVWELQVPLSLLLFSTLAIGVVLTVLFSIPGWNRKRKVQKYHKKRIQELEGRIEALLGLNRELQAESEKAEKKGPSTPN